MNVYHDYTLVSGTSEGDATSDDGRRAWFCFVTDLEDPSRWQLGVSDSSDTDILGGIANRSFNEFYREGQFKIPQTELDIMKFIEKQLGDYYAGDQNNKGLTRRRS